MTLPSAYVPVKPIFLWDNLFTYGGPVSASYLEAGYPAANAVDWRTYTWWKSAAAGVSYLFIDTGAVRAVDSFAYISPDALTNLAMVGLQGSMDGISWFDIFAPSIPPCAGPVMRILSAPVYAKHLRLKTTSTLACLYSVVVAGRALWMERGDWLNSSPSRLARDTDLSNVVSEHGEFLGRTTFRQGVEGSFNFDFLTPVFIYNYWRSFVLHAEAKPFFCLRHPSEFIDDAMFIWVEGAISPASYSKNNFLSTGFKFKGKGRSE